MIELPQRAGLVVAFVVRGEGEQVELGCWLHVSPGHAGVVAYTGKVEVGQGLRTALTQIVAEELHTGLAAVRIVLGDTACTPFDIGTLSSLSVRTVGVQLRRVAAVAHAALLERASALWGVDRDGLELADGSVRGPGGRHTPIGELVRGLRQAHAVTGSVATSPPERWTVAGTPAAKRGARDYVTGAHRFASDLSLPGMRCGRVLRPPAWDAKLVDLDLEGAERIRDVTVVCTAEMIGAVAADDATAGAAVAAMDAAWDISRAPSRAQLFEQLRRTPVARSGRFEPVAHTHGAPAEVMAAADVTLRHTYSVAHIAHVPPEPRAALARWDEDSLTVWTATQRPFAVRAELASAFALDEREVRVIVPDGGCAFGGKHTGEAALEAARLARAAGCPVRVSWTRGEEFMWAYVRRAGVIDAAVGARADGTLTAWELRSCNAGPEAVVPPYRIADQHVEAWPARSPLREGPYRGLGATANTFARETLVDELADVVGIDPLELRRRNLDDERLVAVVEAAADAFGWSSGRGAGLACGVEKGGYVATCAQVCVDRRGRPRVERVVQAVDCGAIINPRHLRGQIEGAILQGLGGALFEAVDFGGGRVRNARLSQYRVPRFSDVPDIEVVLIDRRDVKPAGAGESPIITIAPAIGNALFDATGVRLRALPLAPRPMRNAREASRSRTGHHRERVWHESGQT